MLAAAPELELEPLLLWPYDAAFGGLLLGGAYAAAAGGLLLEAVPSYVLAQETDFPSMMALTMSPSPASRFSSWTWPCPCAPPACLRR